MSLFLSNDELSELTGYVRKADVRGWLTKHGYAYEVRADGWPRVLRSLVEARLGVKTEEPKRPRLHLAV